ncbi:MAG TPA: RodZ domain-containing protein [Steroidobacteraceae bacterium]|nr:RodZ domain-containing protein [Steroidobacteraceae bacterium]
MIAAVELGSRMRTERQRRGISVQQAADELRLDARVIESFEEGNFERAGAPVYAKGHLKKYAALLGIPGEDLVATVDTLNEPLAAPKLPETMTPIMARPRFGGKRVAWRPLVTLVVLGVVIVGVLWWKPWRLRIASHEAGRSATSAPSGDPAAAPQTGAPRARETVPGARLPAAAAPTRGAAQAGTAAPTAGTAAPAGHAPVRAAGRPAQLRLAFTAPCWVDVRDAAGTRLSGGIARASTVREIAGRAPLTVILGYATGVKVRVNGRAVALGARYVRDNVGRFGIAADGELQPYAPPTRPRH